MYVWNDIDGCIDIFFLFIYTVHVYVFMREARKKGKKREKKRRGRRGSLLLYSFFSSFFFFFFLYVLVFIFRLLISRY